MLPPLLEICYVLSPVPEMASGGAVGGGGGGMSWVLEAFVEAMDGWMGGMALGLWMGFC